MTIFSPYFPIIGTQIHWFSDIVAKLFICIECVAVIVPRLVELWLVIWLDFVAWKIHRSSFNSNYHRLLSFDSFIHTREWVSRASHWHRPPPQNWFVRKLYTLQDDSHGIWFHHNIVSAGQRYCEIRFCYSRTYTIHSIDGLLCVD